MIISAMPRTILASIFFCNDTATTEIYTLSLHDALPISLLGDGVTVGAIFVFWTRDSRDKSCRASSTTLASIFLHPIAQPNDMALKQMLLMFRGMPSLRSAINVRAAGVNNSVPSYPATWSLCLT